MSRDSLRGFAHPGLLATLLQSFLYRHGAPPQIVWVTCGNTTNDNLNRIFADTFASALQLLAAGETLVEITETS